MADVRLQTMFRLCVSCVLAFTILLALGDESAWLAMLLAIFGLPFILVFLFVSFKHADSINRFPVRWASSAIALAAVSAYLVQGSTGFALSLVLAVPTALIFVVWSLVSPLQPDED